MNRYLALLSLLALTWSIGNRSLAQTKANSYPISTHGFDLAISTAQVQSSNYFSYGYDWGYDLQGKWLFEYQQNRFIGFLSGAGLELRMYDSDSHLRREETHSILAIQVPIQVQFWPIRFMAIETGFKGNFLLINNPNSEVFKPNRFDLVGVVGFRFKLDRALSIGVGIDWGLLPFQKIESPRVNFEHRGMLFSLRYMFYGDETPQ